MGATKEMVIINTTIEMHRHNVTDLEQFLMQGFKVINYKVVPDTKNLYDSSKTFQRLVKAEKKARVEKEKFINEYNV